MYTLYGPSFCQDLCGVTLKIQGLWKRQESVLIFFITNKVSEVEGSVVQCPDISDQPQFFQRDRVYLSDLGNQIFLNTIQGGGGLEEILCHGVSSYPKPQYL